MAESKEYVSREEELGNVSISEEVLATIAAAAAMEVEGISGLGYGLGGDVTGLVNRKLLSRGVHLSVEDGDVNVDIAVLVNYGYVVPEVAKAVQETIASAVENTSGLHVKNVNVTVAGVSFHK